MVRLVAPALFLLLMSTPAHAADCLKQLAQIAIKIRVMTSNIDNLQTTRTPEGGPWQRKRLSCVDEYCSVITEVREPKLLYEPEHPDARDDGYVEYPNINMIEEMASVIDAAVEYELLNKTCFH